MRKSLIIALLLTLLTFGVRMLLVSQATGFAVDTSYFHLRQATAILQTGFPILNDPLSYGGSTNLVSPFIDYIIAGIGFFTGVELAAQIITQLAASLLVLLVFLYAESTIKDFRASLLAALATAFIPAIWHELNSISAVLPSIALGFLLFLCFARISERKWRIGFFITLVAAGLMSPLLIIFVTGLLVYLGLAIMTQIKRPNGEHELIFFATLFTVWLMLVLFKRAFVEYGFSAIWQNVPSSVVSSSFSQLTVFDSVIAIGIIPFIGGMYVLYRHLFKDHQRGVYLMMGLALATGGLVWSRLVAPSIGLLILGIAMVILFSYALRDLFVYVSKTRFAWIRNVVLISATILVLVSAIPARDEGNDSLNGLEPEVQRMLRWIAENSPPETTVLAPLEEGFAVSTFAHRKNVADVMFLLKPSAHVQDITRIYQTPFESEAARLLSEYDVSVILWDVRARKIAGRETPAFASDELCFTPLHYEGSVIAYGVACALEKQ